MEKLQPFLRPGPPGFTFIEFLVVIGIIVLLSTIILPNYRSGQEMFVLQRSATKLAQDLRKAQEMAMSSTICAECRGIVSFGYGIYLKQGDRNYLLYADTHPAAGNEKYDEEDIKIEKIDLEKKVYIKNVSPSSISINFKPPAPKTKISGTDVEEAATGVIILSLETNSTKTKIITVNKAGLIAIE